MPSGTELRKFVVPRQTDGFQETIDILNFTRKTLIMPRWKVLTSRLIDRYMVNCMVIETDHVSGKDGMKEMRPRNVSRDAFGVQDTAQVFSISIDLIGPSLF